jgi:hypothetical protein
MSLAQIETRLAALEAMVLQLQTSRNSDAAPVTNKAWLEEIWGSFSGDAAFEEAMRYGREWREAQRPGARRTAHTKSRRRK